ncbi:TonB-dependent receptor [Sediminitomix flava]|nr:TonB-dependent receptor [Sediminitomix flava]
MVRNLLILIIAFLARNSFAQDIHLHVLEESTMLPIIGATIKSADDQLGGITNAEGIVDFYDITGEKFQFEISSLGFISQTIDVDLSESQAYHIYLKSSLVELNEVSIEEHKEDIFKQSKVTEYLNSEYLYKQQANTLGHALAQRAGINTQKVGVGVSKPVIRGLSANRIVVNTNGIKQQDQQWGSDHGLAISQESVEGIEIAKGASSLLYGSDAMGGVINVEEGKIPEDSLQVSLNTVYKSNNQSIGSAFNLGLKMNNDQFLKLNASYQDYGNYRVPADDFVYLTYRFPIEDRTLANTSGSEYNIGGTFGIDKSWGNIALTVNNYNQISGFFPGAIGIPSSNWLSTFDLKSRTPEVPRQEVNHFKTILNSEFLLGENHLHIDLGYQQNKRRELSDPTRHGRPLGEYEYLALGLDLETYTSNILLVIGEGSNFVQSLGISSEHQQNTEMGFDHLLPSYRQDALGAFWVGAYTFSDKLKLDGGIRYDLIQIEVDEYVDEIFPNPEDPEKPWYRNEAMEKNFSNLSYAIGLNYTPISELDFKLNFAKSFRAPNVPELAMNGVHHGTFRHEKGNADLDEEIGYQAEFVASFKNERFGLTLSPYFYLFKNYIYLSPSSTPSNLPDAGQIYQYKQDDGIHTGFEWETFFNFNQSWKIEHVGEYLYNRRLEEPIAFPFTPPISTLTTLSYEYQSNVGVFNRPFINLEYRITADQDRVDRNEPMTEGFQLVNLHLGCFFDVSEHLHGSFNFRIDNLLDTYYMDHLSRYRILGLPEQGRNVTASVRLWF